MQMFSSTYRSFRDSGRYLEEYGGSFDTTRADVYLEVDAG